MSEPTDKKDIAFELLRSLFLTPASKYLSSTYLALTEGAKEHNSVFAHESAEKRSFSPNENITVTHNTTKRKFIHRKIIPHIDIQARFPAEVKKQTKKYSWYALHSDLIIKTVKEINKKKSEQAKIQHAYYVYSKYNRSTSNDRIRILPGKRGLYILICLALDSSDQILAWSQTKISNPAYLIMRWEHHVKNPIKNSLQNHWRCGKNATEAKQHYASILLETKKHADYLLRHGNTVSLFCQKSVKTVIKETNKTNSHIFNPLDYKNEDLKKGLILGIPMGTILPNHSSFSGKADKLRQLSAKTVPIYRKIFEEKSQDLKEHIDALTIVRKKWSASVRGYGPPPEESDFRSFQPFSITIPNSQPPRTKSFDTKKVMNAILFPDSLSVKGLSGIAFRKNELLGFVSIPTKTNDVVIQDVWKTINLTVSKPAGAAQHLNADDILKIRKTAKKTNDAKAIHIQLLSIARAASFVLAHETIHGLKPNRFGHTFEKDGTSKYTNLMPVGKRTNKDLITKYTFCLMGPVTPRHKKDIYGIKLKNKSKATFEDMFKDKASGLKQIDLCEIRVPELEYYLPKLH